MKNMNMKERYWTMNLQIFAGDGGDDDSGDEGGDALLPAGWRGRP